MAVHESLRLHITSEKFIIEAKDSVTNELLVIDRVTQEINLQVGSQIPEAASVKPIYGILGIIRLVAGPYLIVISQKSKVGEINGHSIWKITDTEIYSYKRTMLHLTEKQITDNRVYLTMVESFLKTDGFYFSSTFDLSHSLQRLANTSPDFMNIPLFDRGDPQFIWNGHITRELAQQPELGKFCLPVVHGFVSIRSCTVNNKAIDYILISRRSVYRAGTRFYMRGLDSEGQAANFVETEQMLLHDGHKCSLVQSRGSIPLYWSQRPNLKYKPTPVISSTANHMDAFNRHFDAQIYSYGKQVLINLIDHKKPEGYLEKAFAQMIVNAANKDIRYEAYDFHHECRNMRWERLSILIDLVREERKELGFFSSSRDGITLTQQNGVFRTNCIDCLDRTNVVQSMIAKESLQDQLFYLQVLPPGKDVMDSQNFSYIFKNVWADNADILSKQYASTGALKTDFTRTGKRTKYGLMMDGLNSLIRYFKNNFKDGFRQDSIDLFLGNYLVEEQEGITRPSPLVNDRDWKFYALPAVFFVSFAMLVICLLLPDEHATEQILYIFFWGGFCISSVLAIYMFGEVFVDAPRLAQAKVQID
ncbi:phosphatidylinositol-3-phosphatase SAC1 [Octopus bimaculoides]|uniref:Phosphatidylinositol-3-phosphatase SAC1 n=1 Tax=Octopus bimaculoides TaxID=37653 RepID=A0A0L8G743_OCTBM|nr:phosphatidylinositol-3-phosphatase SAC1 [Octopus bimaculoides]|eukprot:XP_014783783.1 PREDICTED: phosphatidylinositide phosphatase SAC1-like [Octopus bimaculoides]